MPREEAGPNSTAGVRTLDDARHELVVESINGR